MINIKHPVASGMVQVGIATCHFYIESFAFLEIARREEVITPLAPFLNPPLSGTQLLVIYYIFI